jgi:hypothetical protein
MNKLLIIAGAFTLGLGATSTMAGGAATGAAGGAVTGAIVGGPVGAAVGGVAGAIVGTAIEPPPREVVTYVQQQPAPADAVEIQQPIVVGKAIPDDVEIVPVPQDPRYGYAIVNNERLIVEPKHRTVIQVLQ